MNRFILFFAMIFIAIPQFGNCQTEKRKALVIGNTDYVYYSKLNNSIRDADSIAVALSDLGFEVTVKKNVEYRTLTAAISKFIFDLEKDDIALVYYSGHGIGYNGNNYLLPIEENLECLRNLEELYPISLNRMVQNIENKGVKNSFVFIDACRNQPNFSSCDNSKGFGDKSNGLVMPTNNPRGNLIFFATSIGSTANDNTYDKYNSLFTSELLKYIRTPDLGIRSIADSVISGVEKRSNYQQIPQKIEDLRGDYVFIKTSDEEKARRAAVLKKKQEDEIREKLLKEIENAKQEEISKVKKQEEELKIALALTKKQEDENRKNAIEKKKQEDFLKIKKQEELNRIATETLEKNKTEESQSSINKADTDKTEFKDEILIGDGAYQIKSYKVALDWYKLAKTKEGKCIECVIPNNALNETIMNLEHNIEVIKYKKWKTTNKMLLGTSVVALAIYSKYGFDVIKTKNTLNANQKLADPDGDRFIYLSNTPSSNVAYNNYKTAYNNLSVLNDKSKAYTGVIIGSAVLGSTYIVSKLIGRKKPENLEIRPLSKGLGILLNF
jgi:hypothetical protein